MQVWQEQKTVSAGWKRKPDRLPMRGGSRGLSRIVYVWLQRRRSTAPTRRDARWPLRTARPIHCKNLSIAIVYGYPERDGDTVYNSAIFIDQHGRPLANHRKTVLPIGNEPDWFATGSGFSIFRFGDATIAMVICYECEFPEIVRSVALGGAEVVLVVTAGGKDWEQVSKLVVPSRAYENGIFMVYANYCGTENGHGFCGLSCIIDPSGADLARARKAEGTVSAVLDLGLIAEARARVPFLKDQEGVVSKLI